MKRKYTIKPRDLTKFGKTAIGMCLVFDWTDKTDLEIFVPEDKVWGLVDLIEKYYTEEDDAEEPEGIIV